METHFRCLCRLQLARQHTSAYVSMRQHASAHASIRHMRQHASACVSMRQHTSAYVSIRQHTSAHVSIRQHTSACIAFCRLQLASHLLHLFAHTHTHTHTHSHTGEREGNQCSCEGNQCSWVISAPEGVMCGRRNRINQLKLVMVASTQGRPESRMLLSSPCGQVQGHFFENSIFLTCTAFSPRNQLDF